MKRTAAAVLAATTALSLAAVPAHAADEENQTSSKSYGWCVDLLGKVDEHRTKIGSDNLEESLTGAIYSGITDTVIEEMDLKGSSNEGTCLNLLLHEDSKHRAGTIAFLVLVPLAIVAVLGGAAAAAGVIPGVQLPF